NTFTATTTATDGWAEAIDRASKLAISAGGFIADAWQGLHIVWYATTTGLLKIGKGFAWVGDKAARAAQWIGEKFVAAWDLTLSSWGIVGNTLLAAWNALR